MHRVHRVREIVGLEAAQGAIMDERGWNTARWEPQMRTRMEPKASSAILQEIGRELRGTYRGLVSEELPEHLACIVARLDEGRTDDP
jgi:hypothetical protein